MLTTRQKYRFRRFERRLKKSMQDMYGKPYAYFFPESTKALDKTFERYHHLLGYNSWPPRLEMNIDVTVPQPISEIECTLTIERD